MWCHVRVRAHVPRVRDHTQLIVRARIPAGTFVHVHAFIRYARHTNAVQADFGAVCI